MVVVVDGVNVRWKGTHRSPTSLRKPNIYLNKPLVRTGAVLLSFRSSRYFRFHYHYLAVQ